MTVELFDAGDERLEHAIAVRIAVFVDEQGVELNQEIDGHDTIADSSAVHAVAYDDGRAAGAGRMYAQTPGVVRIGRMAVLQSARGRGVGARILTALIDRAGERGMRRAILSAQVHAKGFYEKFGFTTCGEEFVEAGIAHVEMAREL